MELLHSEMVSSRSDGGVISELSFLFSTVDALVGQESTLH